MNGMLLLSQKLLQKYVFRKNGYLLVINSFIYISEFLLSRDKNLGPLNLGQIWGWRSGRTLWELSNAFFCGAVAVLVPELCPFVEKDWKRQSLAFGDLLWPDLWPGLKNDRTSFIMIFDALLNVAFRVSLHGPVAELEGVFKHTLTPARRVRCWTAARRGLT